MRGSSSGTAARRAGRGGVGRACRRAAAPPMRSIDWFDADRTGECARHSALSASWRRGSRDVSTVRGRRLCEPQSPFTPLRGVVGRLGAAGLLVGELAEALHARGARDCVSVGCPATAVGEPAAKRGDDILLVVHEVRDREQVKDATRRVKQNIVVARYDGITAAAPSGVDARVSVTAADGRGRLVQRRLRASRAPEGRGCFAVRASDLFAAVASRSSSR